MDMMEPGKYPDVRVTVAGTVAAETVKALSPRLLFFTVVVSGESMHEALAKERDGHMLAEDIAELLAHLTSSAATATVRVTAWPEIAPDGKRALHCVQVLVLRPSQGAGECDLMAGSNGIEGHEDGILVPREARAPSSVPGSPSEPIRWRHSGNHTRPANASRHQKFVAWLVDTYGLERLRSGTGVLDVAGGAGGVAFELAFRRGIPCVVVDPRPMKLTARQRRALQNRVGTIERGVRHEASEAATAADAAFTASAAAAASAADAADAAASATDAADAATHSTSAFPVDALLQVAGSATVAPVLASDAVSEMAQLSIECLDDDTCAPACSVVEPPAAPAVPTSYAAAAAELGLSTACLPRQIIGRFDGTFTSGAHARLFAECSIVVGMHPDEATEPIVRAALGGRKAFAVVPCCVFPSAHPERRLSNGAPVVAHEDFCQYLEMIGEGRARRTTLAAAFEGRNDVVYSEG